MYVAKVPNRGSPPAILLRQSYREDGKVKNRTLADLSGCARGQGRGAAAVLKGPPRRGGTSPTRSRSPQPAARPGRRGAGLLGPARPGRADRPRTVATVNLVCAMIAAQVIEPSSKLATARGLPGETAASSLGQVLGVAGGDEDDLYPAMDWVRARKEAIEKALAARHLATGTLVLYDVSSAAFEGRRARSARSGMPATASTAGSRSSMGCCAHPRGCRATSRSSKATPPTRRPWPPDHQAEDPLRAVPRQPGRRQGMLTRARLEEGYVPAQLDWLSALRTPQINALVNDRARCSSACSTPRSSSRSPIRTTPASGSCPVTTRSWPRSAAASAASCWRRPKTNWTRSPRPPAAQRRPLRGKDKIALRIGKVVNRYKMAKHFVLQIADDAFSFTRKDDRSPPRPPLTGSTCCARACPKRPWAATMSCGATRTWPTSNGPFAASTPSWTSDRSGTGTDRVPAHLFYGCCPTTSGAT